MAIKLQNYWQKGVNNMIKINIIFSLTLLFTNSLWADSTIPISLKESYPYSEIAKIYNDKEVQITSFSKSENNRIRNKFINSDEKERIKKIFLDNLYNFMNKNQAQCDLGYISGLSLDLQKINGVMSFDETIDIFKMLRVNNVIDDVFYDILENLTKDHFAMSNLELSVTPIKNAFKNYDKKIGEHNLNALFSAFRTYPDEVASCSLTEYALLRDSVGNIRDSKAAKNKLLKDLSYVALDKKLISIETYHKLRALSKSTTLESETPPLRKYFKIIFSAKNRMIPYKRNYKVINLEDENVFSTERIKRFSRLTRRKLLFQKYDENQIVLLSQAMKKTSQRMGVDPDTKTGIPYLIMEFNIEKQSGQTQNLVERIELDTQSQFNLARRLLRKDMVALQMMKSFQAVAISYEDLVMASLETGYISLDDIEYVTKYDDLWNPEINKTERATRMAVSIAGYATFFLPPPWNITAAVGLSIIEGIAGRNNINGAANDNPNTFIE